MRRKERKNFAVEKYCALEDRDASWIQLYWYTGRQISDIPRCELMDVLGLDEVGCIRDESPHFYPVFLPPIQESELLECARSLANKAAKEASEHVFIPATSFMKPRIVQRGKVRLCIRKPFPGTGVHDLVLERDTCKQDLIRWLSESDILFTFEILLDTSPLQEYFVGDGTCGCQCASFIMSGLKNKRVEELNPSCSYMNDEHNKREFKRYVKDWQTAPNIREETKTKLKAFDEYISGKRRSLQESDYFSHQDISEILPQNAEVGYWIESLVPTSLGGNNWITFYGDQSTGCNPGGSRLNTIKTFALTPNRMNCVIVKKHFTPFLIPEEFEQVNMNLLIEDLADNLLLRPYGEHNAISIDEMGCIPMVDLTTELPDNHLLEPITPNIVVIGTGEPKKEGISACDSVKRRIAFDSEEGRNESEIDRDVFVAHSEKETVMSDLPEDSG